ncbi:putative rna polymerase ii transcriptional [Phaeomoniella chlamydospora]|uniref:Putative rna polymerase ii transcriptional n=1 Tax=Phaeomoniella chlamydospora TaxID=158046 RepID=A0A0G2EL08_PHACM|nr:putative rna polymerase ii transcriptional [Phaeomoniella chlamydospora]
MARPKFNKRVIPEDESDGFIVSDNEPSSSRRTKKPRISGTSTVPSKDSEGNVYWELPSKRRVTITKFHGKTLVNIREYYEKDGKMLPGKKGVAMTMEVYAALIDLLPEIETALKENGENVPRPEYNIPSPEKAGADDEEAESTDELSAEERGKKSNFEATSDEEE